MVAMLIHLEPFFPLHTHICDSNKLTVLLPPGTRIFSIRKVFNCYFELKMQIKRGKKKENRCPNIYIVSETGKNQWESFSPENAATPVLKLLMGLRRRLCLLLWDALRARSPSASRAQGLCDAEPEFPCPVVRAGARPRRPAVMARDGQVREEVAMLAKGPGEMQNCSCARRT